MTKSRLPARERRQQIIEKAAEVFAQFGVEGTRTRDIAHACGINEALIYRHFSGKEELYRDAMVYSYARAVEEWTGAISDEKTGLQCIHDLIKAQMVTLADNPVLNANMWHGISATTNDEELKKMASDNLSRFQDMLGGLVERGMKDGSIRTDVDRDTAAWLVRGITWTFILRIIVDLDDGSSPGYDDFNKLLTTLLGAD